MKRNITNNCIRLKTVVEYITVLFLQQKIYFDNVSIITLPELPYGCGLSYLPCPLYNQRQSVWILLPLA